MRFIANVGFVFLQIGLNLAVTDVVELRYQAANTLTPPSENALFDFAKLVYSIGAT